MYIFNKIIYLFLSTYFLGISISSPSSEIILRTIPPVISNDFTFPKHFPK